MFNTPATSSTEVRTRLAEIMQLDLVGPDNTHAFAHEFLPQSPQRWYLTGYLVPKSAPDKERQSKDEEGEPGEGEVDAENLDDNTRPDPGVRVSYLPSSMGMSVLVGPDIRYITATLNWGDYMAESEDKTPVSEEEVDKSFEEETAKAIAIAVAEKENQAQTPPMPSYKPRRGFRREPRRETLDIPLPEKEGIFEEVLMSSRGLRIVASWRSLSAIQDSVVVEGTKAVSVFVVNDRKCEDNITYRDIAFQVELTLGCAGGFIGRPDLRGLAFADDTDNDERIADLHYRDVLEYAVGHGVSTKADERASPCQEVRTCWLPTAEVPRMDHADPASLGEVVLEMEKLGALEHGDEAQRLLNPLVVRYRAWIDEQERRVASETMTATQRDTAMDMVRGAKVAADRIEQGILSLSEAQCLEAFNIANRAMARSARQRFGIQQGKKPSDVSPPAWRAFQLAFILMNLPALYDPAHPSRKVVDLLFFPTGGGKTEAYLGLAAFTLVMRRLSNEGISSAGVSVIMRYTLRLLTLDQLGRAAALMCALELERAENKALGDWPFEIGLWVGSGATPNKMGMRNDTGPGKDDTAYAKLTKFKNKPGKCPAPIPMEECPWCGKPFSPDSFHLHPPDAANPTDLFVSCDDMHCAFSAANGNARLPIIGVDEPIYRRLPCFLIATVDKFASLPWTGQMGGLFGKVDHYDQQGFYGACDTVRGQKLPGGELPPPDLIIQDELHLISGPLGTIAGIYETAIEQLCSRQGVDGKIILPKIVASTATVRRADRQIRALFGRHETAIFPPPGPDRNDSFFAQTVTVSQENPGRLYMGIAAQGRSMKVALLRTALAMLSGAKQQYELAGGSVPGNPCDPYMTLLAYFNSLRELGGSRRIVEDEVYGQAQARWKRRRFDPVDQLFRDRYINRQPVELTSRVSTDEVANAKRKLAADFSTPEHVDVALATNMISVGLDIVRLGLMMVYGQPKTTSEYIQATSRVGRDKTRPGLILTLLNIHKPRDRSHYERFEIYHRTFYRSVEASSVTPFSPRALDKALAAALVGLCRHSLKEMEPPVRAGYVAAHLASLQQLVRAFSARALIHDGNLPPDQAAALADYVDNRAQVLLAEWSQIASRNQSEGSVLSYQKFEGRREGDALIRDFLDPDLETLEPIYRHFRANRSMRDVEPAVDLLPEKSGIRTNS